MDHPPQFIDADQDFVSKGHSDVVSRRLERNKDGQRVQNNAITMGGGIYLTMFLLTFLLPI